jgi:hypothetical protein
MSDWTVIICQGCNGSGWCKLFEDEEVECRKCKDRGKPVVDTNTKPELPSAKEVARTLCSHWPLISGTVAVGLATYAVNSDWQQTLVAMLAYLFGHAQTPSPAAVATTRAVTGKP